MKLAGAFRIPMTGGNKKVPARPGQSSLLWVARRERRATRIGLPATRTGHRRLTHLAWRAVLATGSCSPRYRPLRTTELVRGDDAARMIEAGTACGISWVNVLLVDPYSARRLRIAQAWRVLDVDLHLLHRIRNVHVRLVVHHMLLQTGWMSQWNMGRTR